MGPLPQRLSGARTCGGVVFALATWIPFWYSSIEASTVPLVDPDGETEQGRVTPQTVVSVGTGTTNYENAHASDGH